MTTYFHLSLTHGESLCCLNILGVPIFLWHLDLQFRPSDLCHGKIGNIIWANLIQSSQYQLTASVVMVNLILTGVSVFFSVEEKPVEEDNSPADLLDNLFRKTKTTPCLYWLPLTAEQVRLAMYPYLLLFPEKQTDKNGFLSILVTPGSRTGKAGCCPRWSLCYL